MPASSTVRRAVAIGYVISFGVAGLDTHILSVMLPSMAEDLGTTVAGLKWAVVGYVLCLAITTPASAWLAGRLGERRVYVGALTVFGFASLACGLAPDEGLLIVARCVQGAGAGVLMPVITSMLYRTYPPDERARLLRILLLPIAVTPALAPVLGGFLAEYGAWRVAFWVNAPLIAGMAVMALRRLPAEKVADTTPFDPTGFVLAAAGLSGLLLVLGNGPTIGWTSPLLLAGAAGAVLALATFVVLQLRRRNPLLDLRLLGEPLTGTSSAVLSASTVAWMGGLLFLTPLVLQERAGLSPQTAGLIMSLNAVGVIISSQTLGRLFTVVGPRRLLVGGHLVVASVLVTLSRVDGGWPLWVLCALVLVAGLGYGVCTLSTQITVFARVRPDETPSAATLTNVNRQISTAVGTALSTALLVTAYGFGAAYLAVAGVAVLAAGIALLIRDRDALGPAPEPVRAPEPALVTDPTGA